MVSAVVDNHCSIDLRRNCKSRSTRQIYNDIAKRMMDWDHQQGPSVSTEAHHRLDGLPAPLRHLPPRLVRVFERNQPRHHQSEQAPRRCKPSHSRMVLCDEFHLLHRLFAPTLLSCAVLHQQCRCMSLRRRLRTTLRCKAALPRHPHSVQPRNWKDGGPLCALCPADYPLPKIWPLPGCLR
jgi:hypothetical protein